MRTFFFKAEFKSSSKLLAIYLRSLLTDPCSVWRPILHPIEDMPLALCDGATIQDSDIVICDHITGSYSAETTYLLRNKRHRWYFWGNQAEDEVILFKNFDSSDQVKATCSY